MPDDVWITRVVDKTEYAKDSGADLIEGRVPARPATVPLSPSAPAHLHFGHLVGVAR